MITGTIVTYEDNYSYDRDPLIKKADRIKPHNNYDIIVKNACNIVLNKPSFDDVAKLANRRK